MKGKWFAPICTLLTQLHQWGKSMTQKHNPTARHTSSNLTDFISDEDDDRCKFFDNLKANAYSCVPVISRQPKQAEIEGETFKVYADNFEMCDGAKAHGLVPGPKHPLEQDGAEHEPEYDEDEHNDSALKLKLEA